jgi:hypothetical protein
VTEDVTAEKALDEAIALRPHPIRLERESEHRSCRPPGTLERQRVGDESVLFAGVLLVDMGIGDVAELNAQA